MFKKPVGLILCIVFLLVIAAGCGQQTASQKEPQPQQPQVAEKDQPALMVYAGAGLRKATDAIAAEFTKETGIEINYTYAGTAQNVSQILLGKKGDVFFPGDVMELEPLREKQMIASEKNLVYHIPALAVPADNPAGIQNLSDLTQPGVKVALGDPKANPIGKLADKCLAKQGLLDAVNKNVVVRAPTVNELFVYVVMGQADAAIIFEEQALGQEDKVELFYPAEMKPFIKEIPVTVLECTENRAAAQKFADFAASPQGKELWQKYGFKPVEESK